METLFKKYFWVLTLLVLTVAGYLTAQTVNEFLSDSLFPETYEEEDREDEDKPEESAEPYSPRRGKGRRYTSLLLSRNVFETPGPEVASTDDPEKDDEEPSDDKQSDADELPASQLDIKLAGTQVIVAGDTDMSSASITLDSRSRLVWIGTELDKPKEGGPTTDVFPEDEEDGGEDDDDSNRQCSDRRGELPRVEKIQRRRIILCESGELRQVKLWGDGEPDSKRPKSPNDRRAQKPTTPTKKKAAPRVAAGKTDYSKFVRKKSMYKYEVDRSMLESQLEDLTELGRQARIVPNYRNGQYEGFKLIGVRPGSLYRALGIRSGDVIKQVNGQAIDSPNKAMMLFEELRNNKQLGLDIERRGQKRTLEYDIK